MEKRLFCFLLAIVMGGLTACSAQEMNANLPQYQFPSEESDHEGTWLTWPHHYTYGKEYRNQVEEVWIEMAYALHTGERVHIIAYNQTEQTRITNLLESEGLDMSQIDFVIAKSDDVWSRDTGPMFVFDKAGTLTIADFSFDGWGGKAPYKNDDTLSQAVAAAKNFPVVSIPDFVLEGGGIELDGKGTAMLCKSSVVSKNRNAEMSVSQAEEYLTRYLGATNFIWLDGVLDEDITDAHIDGMARFYDSNTLLTVSEDDFFQLYEGIEEGDYEALLSAKNAQGKPYKIIELPMTSKNAKGLKYKGSYLNYYVGNRVVLMPIYGDTNDAVAIKILSQLYKDREIVPIDVTALYPYGGMLHCVTQQQPQE